MAISANWNVTWRPCFTTLAPILINFSHNVVNDQCSTSSGKAALVRAFQGEKVCA